MRVRVAVRQGDGVKGRDEGEDEGEGEDKGDGEGEGAGEEDVLAYLWLLWLRAPVEMASCWLAQRQLRVLWHDGRVRLRVWVRGCGWG